jgi:hypothetical protein
MTEVVQIMVYFGTSSTESGNGLPYSSGLLQPTEWNRRLLFIEFPEGKQAHQACHFSFTAGDSAVYFTLT